MPNPTDVPYFEDTLLVWLDRAFQRLDVTPATTMNEIMFAAGQQNVLSQIRAHSNKQRDPSRTK